MKKNKNKQEIKLNNIKKHNSSIFFLICIANIYMPSLNGTLWYLLMNKNLNSYKVNIQQNKI